MVKQIVKPSALRRGDTIGIVAPASSFDIERFKIGVKKLRNLGYKVRYERCIFSKYWSKPGHDKKRAEQINRMFDDKQIKAILCAKAGYGSIDILPYIDKQTVKKNPKVFVGYSDITALLLCLQTVANMVVFHGPVVSGEMHEHMHKLTLEYLIKVISEPKPLGPLKFPELKSVKSGKASGVLIGGNLSLIVNSFGTPYEIDTNDKILFLEDIAEDLRTISGYLKQMKHMGRFDKVKAIVFGKMVDCCSSSDKERSILDVIRDIFSDVDIPIIFGFPSGHIEKRGEPRVTLPLGVMGSVDADKLIVKVDEAGVC